MSDEDQLIDDIHDALTERRDWNRISIEAWEYQPSYGGKRTNFLDDYTPYPLDLFVSGGEIAISTPGVAGGCEQHVRTRHVFPGTQRGLRAVIAALGEHETAARGLDIRGFGECVLYGDCVRDL